MNGPAEDRAPGGVQAEVDEVDGYRMSLLDHLWELRTRVIRAGIAILVSAGLMLPFASTLSRWLRAPAARYFDEDSFFVALNPMESFVTDMKVALFGALFLAAPAVFWQAWQFVAPGLYRSERRAILPFAILSSVFFTGGALIGYFTVLPWAMQFAIGWASDVKSTISVASYLSFATGLLLGCGFVFELPLVLVLLSRLGIVDAPMLRRSRPYAIVGIFTLAAVMTPPDPITQIALGVPLTILFELSILVAAVWGKKRDSAA